MTSTAAFLAPKFNRPKIVDDDLPAMTHAVSLRRTKQFDERNSGQDFVFSANGEEKVDANGMTFADVTAKAVGNRLGRKFHSTSLHDLSSARVSQFSHSLACGDLNTADQSGFPLPHQYNAGDLVFKSCATVRCPEQVPSTVSRNPSALPSSPNRLAKVFEGLYVGYTLTLCPAQAPFHVLVLRCRK